MRLNCFYFNSANIDFLDQEPSRASTEKPTKTSLDLDQWFRNKKQITPGNK